MRPKELLLRFRPMGTPGPAGRPGVPADAEAGPEVELGPVFQAMSATLAECQAIEEAADSAAAATIAMAEREGSRLLAAARSREEPERRAVAGAARQAEEHATNDLHAGYRRQADELESRSDQAIDAIVRKAIELLLKEFGIDPATWVRP